MNSHSEYQKRAYEQSLAWVRGESMHNIVDGECRPDFSCCMPKLFTANRLERIASHNHYCRAHGFPIYTDS